MNKNNEPERKRINIEEIAAEPKGIPFGELDERGEQRIVYYYEKEPPQPKSSSAIQAAIDIARESHFPWKYLLLAATAILGGYIIWTGFKAIHEKSDKNARQYEQKLKKEEPLR